MSSLDVAIGLPEDSANPRTPDSAAIGRSAMRKATWRLIPLLAFGYGVAYMDRVNISFASLQMNRDLHFSNTVYGLGAGLFFLSYAACEIPSNLLLYRIGARRWLARIMITWGLLAMAMMFVRTPTQFYVMRFFLGMAEAGFFPGVIYYLTQWFPANLRARTISRFYVSLPLSSVVMGSVAGALLNLQGTLGLAGWQWLFLLEGLPPVLLSVIFLRYLPDSPQHAAWLSHNERTWITNQLTSESHSSHSSGVASALRNPRVWLFGLLNFLLLATNYAYNFSAPVILQNLTHFDVTRVGFLVACMGLAGAIGMVGNAWLSDRTGRPYLHMLTPCILEGLCYFAASRTLNPWIAVPALVLMVFLHNSIQAPLLAVPTTFLTGRGAAAGLATINMIGILGGFFGPSGMGWARDLTGSYQSGLAVLSLTMLLSAAVVLTLRTMARKQVKFKLSS